jgi:hypothetical protein
MVIFIRKVLMEQMVDYAAAQTATIHKRKTAVETMCLMAVQHMAAVDRITTIRIRKAAAMGK